MEHWLENHLAKIHGQLAILESYHLSKTKASRDKYIISFFSLYFKYIYMPCFPQWPWTKSSYDMKTETEKCEMSHCLLKKNVFYFLYFIGRLNRSEWLGWCLMFNILHQWHENALCSMQGHCFLDNNLLSGTTFS